MSIKLKDRIRGPKGDKHYETRKRSSFYYGNGNSVQLCVKMIGLISLANGHSITSAEYTSLKELVASGAWYKDYRLALVMA